MVQRERRSEQRFPWRRHGAGDAFSCAETFRLQVIPLCLTAAPTSPTLAPLQKIGCQDIHAAEAPRVTPSYTH